MGADQARLDARYGRRPQRDHRRLLAAGVAAFVAVALVWAAWSILVLVRTGLSWRDTGSDLSDPAVARLTFEVTRADGAEAVCSVRATAADGEVVAWADVRVPPGGPTVSATATLRTTRPAAGGGVVACVRRESVGSLDPSLAPDPGTIRDRRST